MYTEEFSLQVARQVVNDEEDIGHSASSVSVPDDTEVIARLMTELGVNWDTVSSWRIGHRIHIPLSNAGR